MATFFLDDLNGSTIAGKSADVNFPTAQTWVNVDAALDGAGNLVPDGSVVDAAFGSATYGPLTSTNVGVGLAISDGPYLGNHGVDLRIEFVTPPVVQDTLSDQYIFIGSLYQNGQYITGYAQLIAGDAVGTVRVRVTTASGSSALTVITGVQPNTKYAAVIRTTDTGTHEMTVFNTTLTCARTITGSNGVHRVMLGAGLLSKVASARLTEMSYSASIRIAAPSAYVTAGAAVASETANASLTGPMQTLFAGFGPSYSFLRSPVQTVSAGGGGAALIGPEIGLVSSAGGPGLVNLLTAPVGKLTGFGGVNAELTAPSASLAVAATFVGWGSAQLAPSVPALAATGKVSAVASAALTAPAGRAAGYSGSIISVSVSGPPTVAATGTTGALGRIALTAPLFDLSIRATAQNHGSAVLAAPTGRLATTGAAWLVAPGATLTAIGTAVVAVSYEAYALNLNHRNPDSPDELTRYTNYPFDRIVRYENSYFGMNATGLYLLEGTTDFAEPTPTKVQWGFKTGLTDFDSPNLKTVNWAYFGGRMAPAATISIHYGDTGEQNYAYSTPRGAEAQNYRQPFGRGIKSRYYAVEAEGSGALSIDSMMFDIASMARKV